MIRPCLLSLFAVFALASCSSSNKASLPCPPIYILGEAGSLSRLAPGGNGVDFDAEIVKFNGSCAYNEKGANVEVSVTFQVAKGSANTSNKAEFSYFSGIPYYYPASDAKMLFPVSVSFKNETSVRFTDQTISIDIPIKGGEAIEKYEIFIGIQPTAEELSRRRQERGTK